MRTPVALVVDTGVDDALALIAAARHPALELRVVVASAGNVALPRVLANTAHVLEVLGSQVPVAAGPAVRSDGSAFPVRGVHGPDGLAGVGPSGTLPPGCFPAPEQVVPDESLLVCLGPLTAVARLAEARRVAPVVASYAGRGEANREMDPGAAAVLVRLGVELRSSGGGDLPTPRVPLATAEAMAGSADPVVALAGALLLHRTRREAGIGDAWVVLRLAEPGIPSADAARRLVELAGG